MRLPNLVGLALVAGVGMGACAHVGTSGPTEDETDDQVAAELRDHHRHHHRGGVAQFLTMSLDTLGEDDTQRPEVLRLQTSLRTCLTPTRELETQLSLLYADGLGAEVLPVSTIDAALTQLDEASRTVSGCGLDTMNQLHALLSPAEREVVADKVQSHWEIWREANDDVELGARTPGGRLADLAEALDLGSAQVDQMSTALTAASVAWPKFEVKPAHTHVLAFAAAFVFPTFDAAKVMADEGEPFAVVGARRTAVFYQTVAPLLTPPQRAELAELLREHAHHPATFSSN